MRRRGNQRARLPEIVDAATMRVYSNALSGHGPRVVEFHAAFTPTGAANGSIRRRGYFNTFNNLTLHTFNGMRMSGP